MPKRTGITSRRRPSFDSLESRSLLSAGNLLTSAPIALITVSPILTAPATRAFPNALALNGAVSFQGASGVQTNGAAPTQLQGVSFQSTEDSTSSIEGNLAIGPDFAFQANSRSQAVPTVAIPSGSAPLTGSFPTALTTSRFAATEAQLSGFAALSTQGDGNFNDVNGLAGAVLRPGPVLLSSAVFATGDGLTLAVPVIGSGSEIVTVSGSFAFTLARSQAVPVAAEPVIFDWLLGAAAGGPDTAAGAEFVAGKGAGPELGGMGYGLLVPGATSLPAQGVTLFDWSTNPGARLVSQPDPNAETNASVATGPYRDMRLASIINVRPELKLFSAGSAPSRGDRLDESPGPEKADLIGNVLPFDRAALGRAINHFFQQIEDLEPGEFAGQGPRDFVILSLAMASTLLALELFRRRCRWGPASGGILGWAPRESKDQIGYPELPGSWPSRLS
jgi:hypothetical protein